MRDREETFRHQRLAAETHATIVPELKVGQHVWFSDDNGEGFREVKHIACWTAEPHTFERSLAEDWTTVTYTDGFVEDGIRIGTHEIWSSGPRPRYGGDPSW